jgi:DNA polymerase III alpha subunit
MRSDNYGQIILNTDDAFEALYSGKIKSLNKILFEDTEEIKQFNTAIKENFENTPLLKIFQEPSDFESIEMFDEANQCTWFMPEEYRDFPIVDWLYSQCTTEEQKARVDEELILFIQHGMFDLLFYLKYLIDTMREHKIVWGVGRGSSVASYVLYLLGIHKIDSIKYKLDIKEFLK